MCFCLVANLTAFHVLQMVLFEVAIVVYTCCAMSPMTHIVTHQVRTDADVGATLEPRAAAQALGVLEGGDDEGESVGVGAPAVSVVPQGDKVGPGDDEAVAAHRPRLRVTSDVSL